MTGVRGAAKAAEHTSQPARTTGILVAFGLCDDDAVDWTSAD
jgi:hypothetical protein